MRTRPCLRQKPSIWLKRCLRRALAGGWVRVRAFGGLLAALVLLPHRGHAYPTDPVSQERTEIRRLKWQWEVDHGDASGIRLPPGALWSRDAIVLRMTGAGRAVDITADTPKDPILQRGLAEILRRRQWPAYNVAILDITHPEAPRYAAIREQVGQTPGSVAKVLVGAALLQALKKRFPSDLDARRALLRDVMLPADSWAMPNHHQVPIIYGDHLEHHVIRSVRVGDTFSLWEWLDHALSPSSNAAATLVWREAILMRLLGDAYPPSRRDALLFSRWDRQTFSDAAFAAVDEASVEAGLEVEHLKLRRFFTHNASRHIFAEPSEVTPLALVQWMLRLEQGRIVDAASSLELKRLLYLTRRRVRYVYAPILRDAAVFFKTGSLYACRPEVGFQCRQYHGNRLNVLNAVVEIDMSDIGNQGTAQTDTSRSSGAAASVGSRATGVVEGPVGPTPRHLVYLVAVMSNELRRNAAMDHAALAAEIHQLITTSEKP